MEQYEKYKAMPVEEVSDFDLHLLYHTIFNKVSVVLTSKIEDDFVLTMMTQLRRSWINLVRC